MKKAIFLDRDGVINELVLNPITGEYEPPHSPERLTLFPWVIKCLLTLQGLGFEIFVVSNQPDYAKGKATLEALHEVHAKLNRILSSEGINIRQYYYCLHHPHGVVPDYSFSCDCRKPGDLFLRKAAGEYDIDLGSSWMVGDRDSDIECGKSAGTKTILIEYLTSASYRGSSNPDFTAKNLKDALKIIFKTTL